MAFHTAKLKGLHYNIRLAPGNFAFELLELLARKAQLERKYPGRKIKIFYLRALTTRTRIGSMYILPSKNGLG